MKKRFLASLLAFCMIVAMLPAMAFAGNITYVDLGGHWCEEPIYKWTEYGVVNGVGKDANGGDLFDPDGLLTREQAAAIFARLLKLEETADVSFFKDVVAGQWYVDGIAKCYAAGIIKGTGIDTFGTGSYLTRADMFTMFCRALAVEGQDACDKVFDDAREVPSYAKEYTNALVNLGYVDGVTATTLQPLANITRAQMVALLDKAIVAYITEGGEYDIEGEGIVLIVTDNEDVTINSDEELTVVISGKNNNLKAGVGTTVKTTLDAKGNTVNGKIDLDTDDEIVVEEEKKPSSSSSSSSDRGCSHRRTDYEDLENGYHREYCTDCGEWVDSKEEHNLAGYGPDYVAPTCTEKGKEHVVCDDCDYDFWVDVDALGHSDEIEDNYCDVCGAKLCEGDDHGATVTIPGYAATCKEDGLTDGEKCSVCGKILVEQEVIPAGKDYCDDENEDNLCDLCGKFYAGISTEVDGSGAVEVVVDDEYVATLTVTDGVLNPAKVNVAVAMNDVDSLGGGVKSYETTVDIESLEGIEVDSLASWLPAVYGNDDLAPYSGANVAVTLVDAYGDEYETSYEISPVETEDGNAVITATPDEDVSEVWHALINDDTVEVDGNDGDSKIVIKNTSYLQIGDQKLEFTANAEDLELNNFDELADMKDQIQDAVVLNEVEELEDTIVLYAGAGCKMAIDGTIATLKQNAKVTVTGVEISGDVLVDLRDMAQGSSYANMAMNAVMLVNELIASTDGQNVEVLIEMTEPAEVTTKVAAEITTAAEDGSVKVEVLSDYSATMVIDGGTLKPSEVVLSLEMNDIDSLDVVSKKHTDTINIESFGDMTVELEEYLGSIFDSELEEITVIATCDDNEVTYKVNGVVDGDAVITAVPTSERAARAMWHAMINDETIEVAANDGDSKIIIDEASYMQIGSEKLVLNKDLVLDNFDALTGMKEDIQDAAELKAASGDVIAIKAGAGSQLAIDGTVATLLQDVEIVIEIEGAELPEGVLADLREVVAEGSVYDMTFFAIAVLNTVIDAVNGATVYVDIIIG